MLLLAEMKVEDKQIKFQIECGPTVNVLPTRLTPAAQFQPTKLRAWSNVIVNLLVAAVSHGQNPKTKEICTLKFVDENLTLLLGKQTKEQFGLIKINHDYFLNSLLLSNIFEKYNLSFDGELERM